MFRAGQSTFSFYALSVRMAVKERVWESTMVSPKATPLTFPLDPLAQITPTRDDRRRAIAGILESYNSNYDVVAEAVQNSIDALEDAAISNLKQPNILYVTVNLQENWVGVLDTGIAMNPDQVAKAFAPNVSFKNDAQILSKRGAIGSYRGYKGVGVTFLAYGTDDIALHSKRNGVLVKARMQYGRAWAQGERDESSVIVEDTQASPLEKYDRGTYVQVQFSSETRPKSLARLASKADLWPIILRTRTPIGQILLQREPLVKLDVRVNVIDASGPHEHKIEPLFYFPHLVTRKPAFRFLDLVEYYKHHSEQTKPPADKIRQDGLYLEWDKARIAQELTSDQQKRFEHELEVCAPSLYAFVPYQGSVWGEINEVLTGTKTRSHLYPGLVIAVSRQRLADKFEIEASRFETFSRNVLVIVHFDNARPDLGRKTLQDDVLDLAKVAADRIVQYLAKQRELLKPAGDAPTPGQREVEKNYDDWIFNVRTHSTSSPLHAPPISYVSTPLTEQDVVGLFHQLSALGVFPGIKVFATSQVKTYDCLVQFDCEVDRPGLAFKSVDKYPLGLSPYILGNKERFSTKYLALEFKNNLDGLIDELAGDTKKNYSKIDICVCWGTVSSTFGGYSLDEITETNLDERVYPGVTHLLRRNADPHVIQVIMLDSVMAMIKAGYIPLPSLTSLGNKKARKET
jgi:hypothetical protein